MQKAGLRDCTCTRERGRDKSHDITRREREFRVFSEFQKKNTHTHTKSSKGIDANWEPSKRI
jgi:hypothetical protein